MQKLLLLLIFPMASLAQKSVPETHLKNKKELDIIIQDYYDQFDRLFPLYSESKKYTDQLENPISQRHRDAQKQLYESTLRRLKTIDKEKLPEASIYDCEILESVLHNRLNHLNYEWHLLPECSFGPSALGSFIVEGGGNHWVSFATVRDYHDFLKRIDIFTQSVCDTVIHYMRLGMEKHIVQPKRMMELVVQNLERAVQPEIKKNPFYEPILKMPASFSDADKQQLTALYEDAITNKLRPAYSKAIQFIKTEYIPACRETVGIWAYPWGKAAYQQKLNDYYGGLLPPDTLLARVVRIDQHYRKELKVLMEKRKFRGGEDAFFKSLPTDSFKIFKTNQEVIDWFKMLLVKVNDSIPKYFSLVPHSKVEVLREPNSGSRTGGARFTAGPEDGSRPDRIYINIGDPRKMDYTTLPRAVLHEGDPGHHYAATNIINLNKNASSLVSKHEYFEPFDEGWASYAETLGKALGMYEDDYSYSVFLKTWANYSFIDKLENGINVDGWTYQQAIDSCVHHGWSSGNAEQIIFRFVSMPAQSHAYPIGYLKIVELLDFAILELKAHFDIREFHAQVLKDGPMPLAVLDKKIRRWVAREKMQTGMSEAAVKK